MLTRLTFQTCFYFIVRTPDLDEAVFCRVIQDIGDFQIDDRGSVYATIGGRWSARICQKAKRVLSQQMIDPLPHQPRTTITMERGNVYIIRYNGVRTLLAEKKVELL